MDEMRRLFKRDISWLSFNYRVLMEAKDNTLPLYERIKFLSIYSSNLEEFYRVRVSEHHQIQLCPESTAEQISSATQTIDQINKTVSQHLEEYHRILKNNILPALAENKINLYYERDVEPFHERFMRTYFNEEVFPFLQPVLILKDEIRSFIRDNRLYIVVRMYKKNTSFPAISIINPTPVYAIIKIPFSKVPRFIELPMYNDQHYMMFVDDMIVANLDSIFPGYEIESSYSVRISRDADFLIANENKQTLVDEIKKNVKKRKIGVSNRFVYNAAMPEDFLKYLCDVYDIPRNQCIPSGRYLNLVDLNVLPNPVGASLLNEPVKPMRVKAFDNSSSIFKVMRKRDMLIYFPYQSFDYVLRFLAEAAHDPKVEEIKITQYRVAEDSAVINTLINAAHSGKKVTVFVELKARFDEENNMVMAEKMKNAGIQIIYSIPGLKVHAKVALVLRRIGNEQTTCYGFISTGNFNEKTARIYSDIGLLTSDSSLINDLNTLFDLLETKDMNYSFKHLLVSQFNMIPELQRLIKQEIDAAIEGKKARIILKMNGLHDPDMIDILYDASTNGVEIDLIVRGICCLIPGQPYSQNIKITRIVDTYLEHSRIWYFYANGEEIVYLSSADWMKRNLSRRIEVAFPVKDPMLRRQVIDILNVQLSDNIKACFIDENLNNIYKKSDGAQPVRAQKVIPKVLEKYELNG